MNPGELSWIRLFLLRGRGDKIVLNPFHCEQLGIVEIPDHSMRSEERRVGKECRL